MGAFFTLCHDVIIMNSDRGWWCLNEIWIGSLFPEIFKELIRSNITNVFKYSDTPLIPDLFYFSGSNYRQVRSLTRQPYWDIDSLPQKLSIRASSAQSARARTCSNEARNSQKTC